MYMYGKKYVFFFFKQKTAYEMRISDWSSDVCSSDLGRLLGTRAIGIQRRAVLPCYRAGRGDESDQREIWQRPGPQGIQPCVRSICAVRNPGDPGNGQRGSLYPGRAAHE